MKYEYRVIRIKPTGLWFGGNVNEVEIEKVINDLAKDHWELISVSPIATGYGSTKNVLFIFKREKK